MEKQLICLDTSVRIDYFRQKDKTKSFFYALAGEYDSFAVSAVTEYEIYIGSNAEQDKYWNGFFEKVIVLPYDSQVNKIAIDIFRKLKRINKLLDAPDLFIAASAIANEMQLATLNEKHFSRIKGLKLVHDKN